MTGFVLRAPWYVRERLKASVLDSSALRPAIQMYDGTNFVQRLLRDPRDSLAVTKDDYWSYPVPVSPTFQAAQAGRLRLATHQLVYTGLRKLYQPSHNRFYVLVAEVLCDQPGFPRAGQHDDFDVAFVMRRYRTSVTGERGPTRRLARQLMLDLAHADHIDVDDEDDDYHHPPHTRGRPRSVVGRSRMARAVRTGPPRPDQPGQGGHRAPGLVRVRGRIRGLAQPR